MEFKRITRNPAAKEFKRITQDPAVMRGAACIRGMRVTVSMVVDQIASGHTFEELLADFPYLERQDIVEALHYAAQKTREPALATKSAPGDLDAFITRADMLLDKFRTVKNANAFSRTREEYDQRRFLLEQALELLELAALADDPRAAAKLGDLYSGTENDCRDFSKALRWYEVAAKADGADSIGTSAYSMYRTFEMYARGEASMLHAADAVEWCRRSADLGYYDAQLALAETLYRGVRMTNGVTLRWYSTGRPIVDEAEAIRWYCIAVESGHPEAIKKLELVIRDRVEDGDGEDIRKWLIRAAEKGHASAESLLEMVEGLMASTAADLD